MSNFSIKQDNELIAKGSHFWCKACVVVRPLSEQSPDPRYCQQCFKLLTFEASLLRGHDNKPAWIPKIPKDTTARVPEMRPRATGQATTTLNADDIGKDRETTDGEMSTVKARRKAYKPIPNQTVMDMAAAGLGSKAISTKLKEQGVNVSYKTIQRKLSAARKAELVPAGGRK